MFKITSAYLLIKFANEARENSRHFATLALFFPAKWRLRNEREIPYRGRVMRHQYGISALVSQTSFRRETSGGVATCRLFPQARFARLRLLDQLRSKEPANKHARFSHCCCCCCCCFQAVFETTLTRVLLPLPVLVIPPFVMQLLER